MARYFLFNLVNFRVMFSFLTNLLRSIALTFVTNSSYTPFLTTSFSTKLPKLLKSVETVFSLLLSCLSTSAFKLANSDITAKSDVST